MAKVSKKRFWEEYDNLTVGEILTQSSKGDDKFRREVVEREQKGRNRDVVISPLVNWNS